MIARKDIAELQKYITNPLDLSAVNDKKLAGVIGDRPSQYSKSPALWNAAFGSLAIDAVYLPFDVEESRLGSLVSALRGYQRFIGANVTVPHKARIVEFINEVDATAERIGAVNTVIRTQAGRLIGFNTDGEGFVQSILTSLHGRESFVRSLQGQNVLLLGAGGAARAVAFHVADLLDGGRLIICNRTVEYARFLADEIRESGHNAEAITEEEISQCASKVALIINSTTKGQGGILRLSDGGLTNLEPYSALAPAHPPAFADHEFEKKWSAAAQADIDANNQASFTLAKSVPEAVRFYDLIYHPEETVFLRHGRLTGHPTMNGKGMIVHQAALAFSKHICATELQSKGMDRPDAFKRILAIMYNAWGG
jgi:shikimate dehydrogenase